MSKVEEIKTLNVDGETYVVAQTSETVQRMVALYNNWLQKEVEAREYAMLVGSAKNDLSRQIVLQIRKEKEDAEKTAAMAAAETQGTTEAEAPEVVEAPSA